MTQCWKVGLDLLWQDESAAWDKKTIGTKFEAHMHGYFELVSPAKPGTLVESLMVAAPILQNSLPLEARRKSPSINSN